MTSNDPLPHLSEASLDRIEDSVFTGIARERGVEIAGCARAHRIERGAAVARPRRVCGRVSSSTPIK